MNPFFMNLFGGVEMNIARMIMLLVTAVFLMSGCANQIKVATNKDQSYQSHLTKTILVTNTPDDALDIQAGLLKLNPHYYSRAIDYLKAELEKNAVSVEIAKTDPLAVDQNKAIESAKERLQATTLLTVNVANRQRGTANPLWSSRLPAQSYEIQISLTDIVTHKTVWKSSFKIEQDYNAFSMDSNMHEIATRIMSSLKDDNLL